MHYFVALLEGIITFVSPCLLPMLPAYVFYFAGDGGQSQNRKRALSNALGFVLGFTLVFMALGAFAGALGGLLVRWRVGVNLVTGGIMMLFGLNYLGVFNIAFLNRSSEKQHKTDKLSFVSAVVFGITFSIGWTPCVGAFLGSALMLAAQKGSVLVGMGMLLCYSLGLGIPFVASALLMQQLKGAFNFIKRHYKVVTMLSGGLLVLIGILTMTGRMGLLLQVLS